MVYKGLIASVSGRTARIIPDGETEYTVDGIVIPDNLSGHLAKNDSVVYAYFPDGKGLILGRTDGETYGSDG